MLAHPLDYFSKVNYVMTFQTLTANHYTHSAILRCCRIRLPSILLAMLCIILSLGCSTQEEEATLAQEHKELEAITLRIHAWTGYAEPIVTAFQEHMKQRGFAVSFDIQAASGLESFADALAADKADLISPAHDLAQTFIQKNLVQPLDPQLLPSLRQVNPLIIQRLKKSDDMISYLAPITFGPYALAYRRDAFPEPPTSYRALWDMSHSGKISIADYDTANIYMTALMLGIPKTQIFNMSEDQLKRVEEELRKLHVNNKPEYWGDNLPVEKAHELTIGTDWGVAVQLINQQDGPQWELLIPDEGATAWVDSWMLSARASSSVREVAHAFIEFSLQAEQQATIARSTSYGVTNIYASRHMTAEELDRYYLADGSFLTRLTLWQPLSEDQITAYRELWKRVRQ